GDVTEHLETAGSQRARGADLVGRHGAHPRRRVDDDNEHGGVDDEEYLRAFADAEPYDGDRDKRGGGNKAKEIAVGFKEAPHDPKGADGETEWYADQRAEAEAEADALQTDAGVAPKRTIPRQFDRLADHQTRCGKQHRVEQIHRSQVPKRKQTAKADDVA